MEARTLKMAAAGCFAVGVLATSFATRFDVGTLFANVFTTLGVSEAGDVSTSTVPVPVADEWKSTLGAYTTITPSAASTSSVQATSTVTDAFVQSLFEAYMINRAEGRITTTEDRVALAEQYVNALSASLAGKPYTKTDILVSDAQTTKGYIQAVANILNAYSAKHEHELVMFKRLAEEETMADADKLKSVAVQYAGIEKGLQTTPVPMVLAGQHVNFLNAIRSIRGGIEDMSTVVVDPIRGVAGLERYTNAVQVLRAAIAEVQLQGRIEKVSFPVTDPGARFMSI